MMRFPLLSIVVFAVAACDVVGGAELRLKSQARCSSSIVRLGDVAEIFAAESWQQEQLAAIELGPAPGPGTRRFLRSREVQDALFVRGINLTEHRLSGSDRIEVVGPGETAAPAAPAVVQVTDSARDRAKRQVVEAIVECLNAQAGSAQPWQVTVELTDEQLAPWLGNPRRVLAESEQGAAVGRGRFRLTVEGAAAAQPLIVEADVALPPAVVAVARNLSVGTILHASDLILKPVASVDESRQPFYRLEDVVGLETIQSLPAGSILGRGSLRRPLVIRRGDAVTLYARAAGLRVRTTVRAREDGSHGDLIAVESLTNREVFYARVTGIQEAEVFAAPAEAAPHVSAADARFGNFETTHGVR